MCAFILFYLRLCFWIIEVLQKFHIVFLSIESWWFRDCVLEGHFKNVSVAFNPKKYFIFDYKIINKDCYKKINHLKKELWIS